MFTTLYYRNLIQNSDIAQLRTPVIKGIYSTFLCQVMYSSLRMALRKLGSLYWGWTRHRADATMEAVRGPVTPVIVRNSAMLGVRRKGTGRLASRSPERSVANITTPAHFFISKAYNSYNTIYVLVHLRENF